MKQVPYPEEGDEVEFKDGRQGKVSSESPVSQDEGDWQVDVEEITDAEGEDLEDDTESEVQVGWSSDKNRWVEIG